jgi:hypothetical protein
VLGAGGASHGRFAHLRPSFGDGTDTLLKPLAWFGDMSFAPSGDGRTAFQRLDTNPRWVDWPDLDAAGRHAAVAYVRTYGPATRDRVHHWLGQGLGAGRGRLNRWLADLRDDVLTEVDVEGETALVLREDADALGATPTSTAVLLLPPFDQWLLGPGTSDEHVVPPAHRAVVSRGAAVVTVGGVVAGSWTATPDELRVSWFGGPAAPHDALAAAATRLGGLLDRDLRLVLTG